MIVAGVDIGGTNIQVGVVDDGHDVVARAKCDTPTTGPDAVIDAVSELVASLRPAPAAMGVGVPGIVADGRVLSVPNLDSWVDDVDLGRALAARQRIPVVLANDVHAGLLGEWVAGAAQGVDDVLGIWMGTGVGGGLILDGRPYRGARGAAGEIGHVIVRPGGALCACGRRGCVEAYAGRRSMTAAATAMVDAGRRTSLFEIQAAEGKARLTSKVWKRALEQGDELAHQLVDEGLEALGIGAASVVNLLDVELVVVGGGLAERLGRPLVDQLAAAAAPWLLRPHPELRWSPAALGDDAGIVGAAALGRAHAVTS